jgi:hypothetical protein
MKPPSRMLLTQSVTVFTPIKAVPPVNGGYATTYSKTIYQHVRYTVTTDKVLHVVFYDVSGAVDYDSIFTEALIVPGEYTGLTPPKEGTEKHFYKVSNIHYRIADGHLHNVGIDAV